MEAGGQRPMIDRDLFYINSDMFYSEYKSGQPPSRSTENRLNSSAEQLPQFQQKLRQVGLDLFSVVVDYNLSWGVLTQKRSQYR